jgi:hypothetical protein
LEGNASLIEADASWLGREAVHLGLLLVDVRVGIVHRHGDALAHAPVWGDAVFLKECVVFEQGANGRVGLAGMIHARGGVTSIPTVGSAYCAVGEVEAMVFAARVKKKASAGS